MISTLAPPLMELGLLALVVKLFLWTPLLGWLLTSPSPGNERSVVNGNIFLPPDKSTIKAVVSTKFNQNQLKGLNSMIAKLTLEIVPAEIDPRDRFSWHRDEEFCRQTLAGLNPCSIRLLQEWPLRSKLDPEVYGPPESAITKEIVEEQIKDFMTFEEALDQGKLFILDYHDILLQYVNKVRDIKGTTLYGSRTLMFLKPTEELMPVAIELTRPPANKKPQWKQVFTPSSDATGAWLWKLAKTHVLAHD